MRRQSKVRGSAQYALSAAALIPFLPFTGPLGLLLYPALVVLAKMGIAEDLDDKHLGADRSIAATWDRCRPDENYIRVSDTEYCDGIFPFTATREHTFTRDRSNTAQDDDQSTLVSDILGRKYPDLLSQPCVSEPAAYPVTRTPLPIFIDDVPEQPSLQSQIDAMYASTNTLLDKYKIEEKKPAPFIDTWKMAMTKEKPTPKFPFLEGLDFQIGGDRD
jgi:hypothetical protein